MNNSNKWLHTLSLERRRAKYKQYREANLERARASVRKWQAKNRHVGQATNHQAKIKEKYPDIWTTTDIKTKDLILWLEENLNCPCVYCGNKSRHIDHKVPLAMGGLHIWSNIQLICEFCNNAKLDYSESEFLEHCLRIARHHLEP